ncbi:type II secretion system inner membrane protein GspF [Castellaniella sp.]|uniref:type II secretion system inner membrane protein GspF n=1 Tax=Castellaniella sp. TaxID=1955812 RepID=UPI002AFFF074|nr:type II secretion system inner membrane protein GspF [Castellaniella sp.]
MPSYHYEAINQAGGTEHGRLDADSERSARQHLRNQGLLPIKVVESRRQGATRLEWGSRIRDRELGWLTRQLASLLAASLPLESALRVTLEQAERPHVARVLASVRDDVRAGLRLGQALAAHPRDFPDIYRALVDAGEQSGDLAEVLERLADYMDTRGALRSKILTAFIYPCIVTLVSIAIVIFLLSYVVPQVVGAFSQAHQTLPLLTRLMLALSHAVQQWGVLALLGLILVYGFWRLSLRHEPARLAWHARVLRLPLVGRYVQGVNVARFAATLAIMTSSRVPLLVALDAAGRTLHNARLQAAVVQATRQVREGSPLALALQAQKVFPPLLIHLVGSGERTGKLPAMLDRAAGVLATDLERRAMTLTALLEPLMILLMGGMVMLIVLAVMMPIIEMNQLIQ